MSEKKANVYILHYRVDDNHTVSKENQNINFVVGIKREGRGTTDYDQNQVNLFSTVTFSKHINTIRRSRCIV